MCLIVQSAPLVEQIVELSMQGCNTISSSIISIISLKVSLVTHDSPGVHTADMAAPPADVTNEDP